MQPLGVVHVLDEAAEVRLGFCEGLVVLQVHLLMLERAEEALSLGVLVGIADRRHADARAGTFQAGDIGGAGVLDTLVAMVDQSRWWLPGTQSVLQRSER